MFGATISLQIAGRTSFSFWCAFQGVSDAHAGRDM